MITLSTIIGDANLSGALAWPYDFDVARANRNNDWIKLSIECTFDVIAGDGTGGVFIAYGEGPKEHRRILYATSEGQAGKISENLSMLIGMFVAIPHWMDILKFSGGGNLSEMRRANSILQKRYRESMPELGNAEKIIASTFKVSIPDDPVQKLHECVKATDCTVVAKDGWVYEILFNKFTIDILNP